MQNSTRWPAAGLLWLGLFSSGLGLPATSDARPAKWVEAFQSSPAAYGVNAPEDWLKSTAGRMSPVTGTLRFQFPVSIGGSSVRIRFSNETSSQPLRIADASVAVTTTFDGKANVSPVAVTFGGAAGVTVPPGAPVVSDAIDLPLKAGEQLLVSADLPDGVVLDSYGATGMWAAPGDQTRAVFMSEAAVVTGRPLISGVSVLTERRTVVIVALGDSITAGGRKSPDELHGWPEALSQRLNAGEGGTVMDVINAGIAGNRLLSEGYGQSALARLDRDVLRLDGLTDVIVLEGINDIGFPGRQQFGITQPDMTAPEIIGAYQQIIARIHARGVRVIGGTLLPFAGAFYYSVAKEEARQTVNRWIRESGAFDAVMDFDAVMRDPDDPLKLRAAYDSGDHLHPNTAGHKAMADAIDSKLLR